MTDPSRSPVVLVADDDEDILTLVSVRLGRAGYEVVCARDGAEALTAAETRDLDAAVIDVMMPRMMGHELVRRLRARPDTATIPIVILTAAVHDAVAEASAESGADVHLRKPFSPRELLVRLDRLLGRA